MPTSIKILLVAVAAVMALIVYQFVLQGPRLLPVRSSNLGTPVNNAGANSTDNKQAALLNHGLISAIAIDINGSRKASLSNVENGKIPILVFAAHSEGSTQVDFHIFNKLASLAVYDADSNGVIDSRDPVFQKLNLAYLSLKQNRIEYMPISKANIKGLILNPDHLTQEVLDEGQAKHLDVHAVEVIFNNNRRYISHAVYIPGSYFKNVQLFERPS